MFVRWARVVVKHRSAVLVSGAFFMVAAATYGAGLPARLDGGGWDDPNAQSILASNFLRTHFAHADSDVVALYKNTSQTVDNPAYAAAVNGVIQALPKQDVTAVDSYYSTGSPVFVSADRHETIVVVQLAGAGNDARETAYRDVRPHLVAPGLDLKVGGQVATAVAIEHRASTDLRRAELYSTPVLLLLLLLVFRSVTAAALPVFIGAFAIITSTAVLRAVSEFTEVSAFALNIVFLLGLGLAVDYSLLMVSRFREEQSRCGTPSAVGRTVSTAGRAIAFSALTVAGSLGSLMVFPQPFLKSMGLAGITAVIMAMMGALTILPSALAVLGPRINGHHVRHRAEHFRPAPGLWGRWAVEVMGQPLMYLLFAVALLLTLGMPFFDVRFSRTDASDLPRTEDVRQVGDALTANFGANQTMPIAIAIQTPINQTQLHEYVSQLEHINGITGATPQVNRSSASLFLSYSYPVYSQQAQSLVNTLRAEPAPAGAKVLVGGPTAQLVDLVHSRNEALLPMFTIIAGVMALLLFLAFGSIVLPVKAILVNVLSLTASFGAVVWIFQQGHGAGLIGGDAQGAIDATQPILMLAVVFGLSMDYEIFLLSRVREAYLATGNSVRSVAIGMQRSGPIISRAALLMIVVVAAFSTSEVAVLKMIGVGTAIAIAIDATIVRLLLVPSIMRLMGKANWWAPSFLRRFHVRFFTEPVVRTENASRPRRLQHRPITAIPPTRSANPRTTGVLSGRERRNR